MLILGIRTDKPEAELYLYDAGKQLAEVKWHAHRQLAETIHRQISDLVEAHDKTIGDIKGIVIFEGPGSFTGLRIGMSTANALSYSLAIPIVSSGGDSWMDSGIKLLLAGKSESVALPQYGSTAHITRPKR